jgi:hypothetical protein
VITAALVLSATPASAQPVDAQPPPTWRDIPGLALDATARWVKRQIDARNLAKVRAADEKAQEKTAKAQAAAEELRLSEALFDRMLNEDGTGPEVQRAEVALQAARAGYLEVAAKVDAAHKDLDGQQGIVGKLVFGRVLAHRLAQERKRWNTVQRAYDTWVKAVERSPALLPLIRQSEFGAIGLDQLAAREADVRAELKRITSQLGPARDAALLSRGISAVAGPTPEEQAYMDLLRLQELLEGEAGRYTADIAELRAMKQKLDAAIRQREKRVMRRGPFREADTVQGTGDVVVRDLKTSLDLAYKAAVASEKAQRKRVATWPEAAAAVRLAEWTYTQAEARLTAMAGRHKDRSGNYSGEYYRRTIDLDRAEAAYAKAAARGAVPAKVVTARDDARQAYNQALLDLREARTDLTEAEATRAEVWAIYVPAASAKQEIAAAMQKVMQRPPTSELLRRAHELVRAQVREELGMEPLGPSAEQRVREGLAALRTSIGQAAERASTLPVIRTFTGMSTQQRLDRIRARGAEFTEDGMVILDQAQPVQLAADVAAEAVPAPPAPRPVAPAPILTRDEGVTAEQWLTPDQLPVYQAIRAHLVGLAFDRIGGGDTNDEAIAAVAAEIDRIHAEAHGALDPRAPAAAFDERLHRQVVTGFLRDQQAEQAAWAVRQVRPGEDDDTATVIVPGPDNRPGPPEGGGTALRQQPEVQQGTPARTPADQRSAPPGNTPSAQLGGDSGTVAVATPAPAPGTVVTEQPEAGRTATLEELLAGLSTPAVLNGGLNPVSGLVTTPGITTVPGVTTAPVEQGVKELLSDPVPDCGVLC